MTKTVIPIRAVLNERLWVPYDKKLFKEAKELFTHRQYEEQQCSKCEYRPNRHCEVCDECPAYLGTTELWKREEKGKHGEEYIGVPTGNRKKIKQWLGGKVKVRDLRPDVPMQNRIKFTGTLHKYQKSAVKQLVEKGYGVLLAPPRSGKTVMATALTCKLRKKTLILASQHDWLEQFVDTFEKMTNVRDIEAFEGRKIMGICNKPEEMQDLDIVFSTYQSFINKNGKLRLKKIKKMFSVVIVDEVHKSSATHFARVLSTLNAKYKFGLTGTYDRKDGSHVITQDIMGPVTVRTSVETLVPTVQLVETPASTTYNYKVWAYAMRYLANHKERNKLIVKHAVSDIKKGRSLVVPVAVVKHAHWIVEAVNKKFGKEVAVAFVSKGLNKKRRLDILERARDGKIKCIVGTRQLVQTGINVPRWDTQYQIAPISNPPNFEQETSRIRTNVPGKQPPLIKHFIEDFGPSVGCFRTCLFQTYFKLKFNMSEDTKKRAMDIVNKKKNRRTSGANFGIV